MFPKGYGASRICTDRPERRHGKPLLEAVGLGLGAVWLGIAPIRERMDRVRDILGLPEHLGAFAVVPVGYPEREKTQQDRYDPARVHLL